MVGPRGGSRGVKEMVNRELIRAKVVQLVYAYYMSGGKPMDVAMKEVETSLSTANDLYYVLLDLILSITKEEHLRFNLHLQKAIREGEKLPSARFVDNRFARQLEANSQLGKFKETHKYDWNDDIEFVRRLCDLIEQTDIYNDYLTSKDDSYEADREVWRKLYKQIISLNDDLDALLEEKSLYWNDDKDIVDTFIIKTIKHFAPDDGAQAALLPDHKDSSDEEFAQKLFSSAIENKEEFYLYMEQASQNWEISRMPFTDIVIMQIAIAEMVTFPEIPLSVTINEYVELSKAYSTPKSATFINAMLDNIAHTLENKGKTLKRIINK